MTREEAIMVLKNEQPHCGKKALFPEEKKYEAFDVAIKALEREPCDDAISRADALKAINKMDIPEDMSVFEIMSHIGVEIGTLPSVQPERKKGHWLDKIRAEIVEYKDDKVIHAERNEMIDIVLEIIDRHLKEAEE